MKKYLITLLFPLLTVLSCSEESNEVSESENFTRIYDNNVFSYSFSAIDVAQTSDGGFIVLASRFSPDVPMGVAHLLRADKYGKFVKDLPLDNELVNALPGLAFHNNQYHFICMDGSSQAKVISVDSELEGFTSADVGLSYPAATSFSDGEFVLLSYDQIEKKTVVSRVAPDGGIRGSRLFTISDDDSMEDEIIKHFLRTGTRFPFQVGRNPSGGFFFNGFYDYTFSLVFTSLGADDDVRGVVQGQQDHGGFSALSPLSGGRFATAFFHHNDNYIQPGASLSTNSFTSIADLSGYDMKEIAAGAPVQILNTTIEGRNVVAYATNTESKQIGIFVYDAGTGEFLGSKYFGFTNPYEFGRLSSTSDGGLVVAGSTYIAGRFSRLALIKMSSEEVINIIR